MMNTLEQRIIDIVYGSLEADRLEKAIVYLDRNLQRTPERLSVGDVVIDVPWDGHIVFVDLEPEANWGHSCCYLAIRLEGDDVIEFAAQMPPFLQAETSNFHFLWKGSLAPEWAVVKNPN